MSLVAVDTFIALMGTEFFYLYFGLSFAITFILNTLISVLANGLLLIYFEEYYVSKH
jgi:hypothetical protein